ncbi:restriction endonuclease subunit S [Mycoplasmopsis felis]|uniref:restriction endonuclease subunit S n=1 Tax=Mycoplasmopsis felis TaxID=33923 RepID=UPI002AFDD13A|nr:restriction endonuclease subunit S [Mycoplasmopsis felis]WQQ10984.1 restriction endonuclease subunit S [Mycoplasmopsis felis]
MKKVLFPRVRFKGFDDNWEQGNIGEVFELTRGEVLSQRKIRNKKMGEYIYPVFSSQTLNNGLLGFYNNFLFKNSITWTTDGANAGTVLYRDGLFYATNVCGVMLQKTSIKPSSYFAHEINVKVKKHVIKAGNPKLMINVLHEVLINFSKNKLEQEKISILIENIDNLITLEEIKLNKLKQLKKTLLQKMFPEGNSKTPRIRFKGFEGEWKEERLENITKRMSSGGTPSTTIKKFYNGKIPFLTISDMTKVGKYINNTEKNITPEAIENSSTWLVPKNSLLLSMYASFGKTAINKKEITTSQAILGIILNNNISVEFLYYLLFLMDINQYWYKQVETGTQPNLSNWTVSKTLIKLTKNISEQQKIGDFFSNIDTLLNLYQSKLNKLKQIKEGLLQKMFV